MRLYHSGFTASLVMKVQKKGQFLELELELLDRSKIEGLGGYEVHTDVGVVRVLIGGDCESCGRSAREE